MRGIFPLSPHQLFPTRSIPFFFPLIGITPSPFLFGVSEFYNMQSRPRTVVIVGTELLIRFDVSLSCAMHPRNFRGGNRVGNAPVFLKVCPICSDDYFLGIAHKSSLSVFCCIQVLPITVKTAENYR